MHFVIMHQDRDASRRLAIIMYVNEILTDSAQRMMCSRQYYALFVFFFIYLFLTHLIDVNINKSNREYLLMDGYPQKSILRDMVSKSTEWNDLV